MELTACIVETRFLPGIKDTIKAHVRLLPKGTKLVIFTGPKCLNIFRFEFPDAVVYGLDKDIFGEYDYNLLLTSAWFWEHFKTEKALIFQHDSMILREGIEDFYAWDFVGAPWEFQPSGGNGGFSLRTVKAMLATIQKQQFNPRIHGNEDVYFCNHLFGKLAPREICEQFSCETLFKLGTLGYHAANRYMTKQEFQQILTQYEPARSEI